MGEEAKITDYSHVSERVTEWEMGLPTADDLTPLSQPLIPPELASAFSISPEPYRTLLEVNRASRDTISALRGGTGGGSQSFSAVISPDDEEEEGEEEEEVEEGDEGGEQQQPDRENENGNENENENGSGSHSRKLRRLDSATEEAEAEAEVEADSAMQNSNADDPSARTTLKRPRLVWTPQLHKRFVDVVAHLGIKNAVPKTIMQLMNVEGLTRENVASHLQKYRLYLKRMQGLSNEGPSSSDPLFASTPVPQSLHDSSTGGGGSGHGNGHHPNPNHNQNHNHHVPMMPVPYPPPPPPHMMAAMLGMAPHHGFNNGGFQQRDWSSGFSYPHHHHAHSHSITPNDK